MQFLAARGIEVATHHTLPEIVDAERIQADQHTGALFHRSRLPALADSDEPAFGFDHHDVGRLVDHRLGLPTLSITGISEVMNELDLVLRQREGLRGRRCPSTSPKRTQSL